MELWSEIRRRIRTGEISMRQACSQYHLNFRTIRKIVRQPEPTPFHTPRPRARPILGSFLTIVHQIIDADRHAPPKQRHTARRLDERLRDEHGYPGCPSIIRDAVRVYKQSQAEVFVPLLHPPGEGQVDFGHAEVIVAGVRHKAALFALTLLLVLDELGYVPASQVGAERLFDVVGTSYERTRVIVTTNLPLERWTEVLGVERLVAATLDRRTHRCRFLEATGESRRLKEARGRRQSSGRGGGREEK